MLIIKYRKGAEAREKRAIYKYKGRLQNFVPFYHSPGPQGHKLWPSRPVFFKPPIMDQN